MDLPGFAEQLAALDHAVVETRGAGVALNDSLDDDLAAGEATDSEGEEPFLFEPKLAGSTASFELQPWWAGPIGFVILMLVGATAAALVFHRQVSLLL